MRCLYAQKNSKTTHLLCLIFFSWHRESRPLARLILRAIDSVPWKFFIGRQGKSESVRSRRPNILKFVIPFRGKSLSNWRLNQRCLSFAPGLMCLIFTFYLRGSHDYFYTPTRGVVLESIAPCVLGWQLVSLTYVWCNYQFSNQLNYCFPLSYATLILLGWIK